MKLIYLVILNLFAFNSLSQNIPTQKNYIYFKILDNYFINGGRTFLETIFSDTSILNYKYFVKNTKKITTHNASSANYCHQVCPENMNILNINSRNLIQNESNSLSFLNQPNYFKDIMQYDYGFCWGHARLTTQLRYLAFFDPENIYLSTKHVKYSERWKQLIRNNLLKITQNQPQFFPYIKSIRELSELFPVELKKFVIRNWSNNAISIENYLNTYRNQITYSKVKLLEMIKELQLRLSLGQEPEVIFNIWGSDEWIHVVLVKNITFDDYNERYTLYLDDSKQYNNISTMLEPSTLVIDLKSQTISYPKATKYSQKTRVGRMELTKSNYLMYNDILPRLVRFCRARTKCVQ